MRSRIQARYAKAPTAGAEIEHDVARSHVEEFAQHRVAYGRRQQRRRNCFVPTVGVKAFLEKFCRLAERTARTQHKKVVSPLGKCPAACNTLQSRRLTVEPHAAIRASDEL